MCQLILSALFVVLMVMLLAGVDPYLLVAVAAGGIGLVLAVWIIQALRP